MFSLIFLNKTGIVWMGKEKGDNLPQELYERGFLCPLYLYGLMHIFFTVASDWVNARNLFGNFYSPEKRGHSFSHFIALFITVLFILQHPLNIISLSFFTSSKRIENVRTNKYLTRHMLSYEFSRHVSYHKRCRKSYKYRLCSTGEKRMGPKKSHLWFIVLCKTSHF